MFRFFKSVNHNLICENFELNLFKNLKEMFLVKYLTID